MGPTELYRGEHLYWVKYGEHPVPDDDRILRTLRLEGMRIRQLQERAPGEASAVLPTFNATYGHARDAEARPHVPPLAQIPLGWAQGLGHRVWIPGLNPWIAEERVPVMMSPSRNQACPPRGRPGRYDVEGSRGDLRLRDAARGSV